MKYRSTNIYIYTNGYFLAIGDTAHSVESDVRYAIIGVVCSCYNRSVYERIQQTSYTITLEYRRGVQNMLKFSSYSSEMCVASLLYFHLDTEQRPYNRAYSRTTTHSIFCICTVRCWLLETKD